MPLFGGRRKDEQQSADAERLRRAAEAERSGLTCLKDGNHVAAEVELRRCVDLNPDYAVGHGYYGLALYRLGRLVEADQELRLAISLSPTDEVLHRTHGMILEALGRVDDAAGAYSQAIEIAPQSARAHAALGSLALKRGDLQAAEEHVVTALNLDSQDPQAIGELAEIRRRSGNLEGAIAQLRKALLIRPQSSAFHFKLGLLLEETRQLRDALAELRLAHEVQPFDPEIIHAYGRLLMRTGHDTEVQSLYERAIKGAPAERERFEADLYHLLVEFPTGATATPTPDAPRTAPASIGKPDRAATPATAPDGRSRANPVAPDVPAAIAQLEAALVREPGNSRIYRDLSIQYMRAGRLREAKDMARTAESLRAHPGGHAERA